MLRLEFSKILDRGLDWGKEKSLRESGLKSLTVTN